MLPFLLFGLALLVGFMLLSRWVASADPATLAKGVRWVLVVVGVALVAYLAVSGRLFYAIAAAPVLIPTILRWASLVRAVRARASGGRPSGGQTSDVETGYLRMTLDHDSGTVNGTVTAGRFAGRQLSELSPDELTELLGQLGEGRAFRHVQLP